MKTLGNILIIIFVVATVYALRSDVMPVAYRALDFIENVLGYSKTNTSINTIPVVSTPVTYENNSSGQINAPGPLQDIQQNTEVIKNSISAKDIVDATNYERAKNGSLKKLSENNILDKTASAKASDMLAKQYFEHTSPSGVTVGMQAKDIGYEYIILGENLALGTFSNAQTILDAWMKSPGHRANILNSQYSEIGVGIVQGLYKNQTVWIAVQHFGLPRSACPDIDISLKADISIGQGSIAALKNEIDAKSLEINHTDQYSYQYGVLVSDYNSMIRSYNVQIIAIKAKIATFNDQVNAFNTCAQNHRRE